MSDAPRPPKTYRQFTERFPELERAWEAARRGEAAAPFDAKTLRLLKLALAAGARQQGAVHSATRKALAAGAGADEVLAVAALAATTLGFPGAVAVFSWIRDELPDERAGD